MNWLHIGRHLWCQFLRFYQDFANCLGKFPCLLTPFSSGVQRCVSTLFELVFWHRSLRQMAPEDSTPLFYHQTQDSCWWFLPQHFLQTLRNLGLISTALLALLTGISVKKYSEFPGLTVSLVGLGRGGETSERGRSYCCWGAGSLISALCWSWDQGS